MYKLELNKHLYLKDPQETELGRKIVEEAILLIEDIGFELFTFKKLAQRIDSVEASIYRYFENKTKLLIYLVAYYWRWLDFKVSFATNNLQSAEEKLRLTLKFIVDPSLESGLKPNLNEIMLHRIVANESLKSFFNKEVDQNNKDGFFLDYKHFCGRIATLMLELNPSFAYPNALASMIVEAAHHQIYYAEHLPKLTNLDSHEKIKSLINFLECVLFSALKNKGE
ncbi:MAG: TetR family transcriptional regulator [Cytophagaceae bacterium]|nr:TetR family transcriptional regulator [Cytophagaceae bacterium]